ncbi:hypothetical protein V8E36_000586 [Tilletia maclaganii]
MKLSLLALSLLPAAGSAAAAAAAASGLISVGLGTFSTASSGNWLYFDTASSQIQIGSFAASSPPATVFNVTAGATKGNYRILVTDNQLYVSTGNGTGIAKGTSKTASTFQTFNLTGNTDGTFYIKSWNGAWNKTTYSSADSSSRLVFGIPPAKASTALKFKWNPNPYRQTADGSIIYRTVSTDTTATALKYNISTFYPKLTGPTGQQMAYTVKWIGDARIANRPMLMYLGGSDSRSNQIMQETDVLDKTESTGFPKVVTAANSTLATALLSNYLLVVPASPTCYNTTTNTFVNNNCGTDKAMHFIKHYRPAELKRIYDEVLARYSFDTTRFALVGTGMGGRGGLRFAIEYPTLPAAVSMVSGALESNTSMYINALPYIAWNSGEGCWDVTKPNVGGVCADADRVRPTVDQGSKLAGFPIRLWSSRNDDTDTLQEALDTCTSVNAAPGGNCTVIDTNAPTHHSMAYYGRDVSDVNWLLTYQRLPGQNSQVIGAPPVVTTTTTTTTTTTSTSTDVSTPTLTSTTTTDPASSSSTTATTDPTPTDSASVIPSSTTSTDASTPTSVSTDTPPAPAPTA